MVPDRDADLVRVPISIRACRLERQHVAARLLALEALKEGVARRRGHGETAGQSGDQSFRRGRASECGERGLALVGAHGHPSGRRIHLERVNNHPRLPGRGRARETVEPDQIRRPHAEISPAARAVDEHHLLGAFDARQIVEQILHFLPPAAVEGRVGDAGSGSSKEPVLRRFPALVETKGRFPLRQDGNRQTVRGGQTVDEARRGVERLHAVAPRQRRGIHHEDDRARRRKRGLLVCPVEAPGWGIRPRRARSGNHRLHRARRLSYTEHAD